MNLEQLRAFSIGRSLWREKQLQTAISRFGFVQADPIRAPARAQDLILMQRVKGYLAGDLERNYQKLGVEEDFFVNYGFVTREMQTHMHPRAYVQKLKIEHEAPGLTAQVLEFVRENGATHPKDLEREFGKQRVGNYWGGGSQATTRALDGLHYRGHLRVARRDNGIKVYEAAPHLEAMLEKPLSATEMAKGLIDLIVSIYAPLPEKTLHQLVAHAGYGAPHLKLEMRKILQTFKTELETVTLDGVRYFWKASESLEADIKPIVRLLAPFDPVVWDRRRFEHLHGWEYRFEAYTPPAKRIRGYYALPLLWQDKIIGWGNLKVLNGKLESEIGFVNSKPKSKAFNTALEAELDRMRAFLGAI
jgi:uncharacterized protein YcaQ